MELTELAVDEAAIRRKAEMANHAVAFLTQLASQGVAVPDYLLRPGRDTSMLFPVCHTQLLTFHRTREVTRRSASRDPAAYCSVYPGERSTNSAGKPLRPEEQHHRSLFWLARSGLRFSTRIPTFKYHRNGGFRHHPLGAFYYNPRMLHCGYQQDSTTLSHMEDQKPPDRGEDRMG